MIYIDDDFGEVLNNSDSPSASAYTDTESEPEVEAGSQSDAVEQTEADDDIQYNWQSQLAVEREPFPLYG